MGFPAAVVEGATELELAEARARAEAAYLESGVLMISPTANPATCFAEWMATVTGHALVTEGSIMTRRGPDRMMGERASDLRGSSPLAECG